MKVLIRLNFLRISSLLILVLVVCGHVRSTFGQGIQGEELNANLVHPDLWSIPGLPSSEVGSTGDLNLQIPILTVPGRGIDFPITFNYSSDIKVDQQASWIGLGWSFDPGSITREVDGGGRHNGEDEFYGLDSQDVQSLAQQPDIFYVSIPGRGAVQMTQSNQTFSTSTIPAFNTGDFVINEHRSWRVDSTLADSAFHPCDIYPGEYSGFLSGGACNPNATPDADSSDIKKFVITTEDGIRYVFDAPTLASYWTILEDSGTGGELYIDQVYVNSWRLRAILGVNYSGNSIPDPSQNPSGDWVVFTYSKILHGIISSSHPLKFVQNRSLYEVITPTHIARFNTSDRQDQENFPSFTGLVDNNNPYRSLDSIELYARRESGSDWLLKKVVLDELSTGFGPNDLDERRRGLSSITVEDRSSNEVLKYNFEYSCDVELGNPNTSWGYDFFQDDFGYLNPATVISTNQSVDFSNCSSPSTIADAWRLTKITYPTGGTVEYDYELDVINTGASSTYKPTFLEYYNTGAVNTRETYCGSGSCESNGGGSRIKTITQDDAVSANPDIVTNYSYGNGGYVTSFPYRAMNSINNSNLDFFFRPGRRTIARVVYDKVVETGTSNGSVERYFTTSLHSNVEHVEVGSLTYWVDPGNPSDLDSCTGGTCEIKGIVIFQGNGDWNWGKQYKTVYKNGSGDIIQVEKSIFDFSTTSDMGRVWDMPIEIPFVVGNPIDVVYSRANTDKIETYYCPDGVTLEASCNAVTTVVDYSYSSNTNQVTLEEVESSNADVVVIRTQTEYAHEEYDGAGEMESLNMLSQVYNTTVSQCPTNACASTSDVAKSWTEWSATDGYWRPRAEYVWNPSDPTDTTAPAGFAGQSEVREVSRVEKYNDDGKVEEYGVVFHPDHPSGTPYLQSTQGILWANQNTLPGAIISNGSPEDVLIDSFEEGLDQWQPTDGNWNTDTGKASWGGSLSNSSYLNSKNGNTVPVNFVAEYDIRIKDALTSGYWGGFQFRKSTYNGNLASGYLLYLTKSGNLVFYDGSSAVDNYIIDDVADFHRIRLVAEGSDFSVFVDGELVMSITDNTWTSGQYVSLVAWKSHPEFDNVRVYPVDALVTSATYDEDTNAITSITDEAGVTTEFLYDKHNRLTETRNQKGAPIAQNSYFLKGTSLSTNTNFDDYAASFISSVLYVEEDGYDDFSDGDNWTLISGGGNITFGVPWLGESTVEMARTGTSGYDTIALQGLNTQGTTNLRVDFYPTDQTDGYPHVIYFEHISLGERCAIKYHTGGSLADKFVFQRQHSSGSYDNRYTFELDSPRNQWYTVELEKREDDTCRGWVYPKGEGRNYADMWIESGYPSGWSPDLRSSSDSDVTTPYYLANFYVGDVNQTKSYLDGLGRVIQTQAIERDSIVVSGIEYDQAGREAFSWVPSKNDYKFFVYNSEITSASATTGSTREYFDTIHLDDKNRPYTETVYEASPLNRPVIIKPPGYDASPDNSVKITYSTAQLPGAGGSDPVYTLVETTDEDDIVTKEYSDTFGNIIRGIAGDGSTATNFEYDALGQLTKVTSPKGYATYYHYDKRGRLVGKTTPDADGDADNDASDEGSGYAASDYLYKYDSAGNLRFVEDPNQRDAGEFIYYLYNKHNRLIAEGVYTGMTTFSDADPDDEDWPSVTDTYEYVYDGALLKTVDMGSDEHRYYYDELGQLTGIDYDMNEFSLSYPKVEYEYDLQGKVSKTIYSSVAVGSPDYYAWNVYDELGRLAEVRTNGSNNFAGASSDMTYEYTSQSQVGKLVQGDTPVQTQNYFYNIRGWLTGINDPLNMGSDVFGLRLGYDQLDAITNSSNGMNSTKASAKFNGNISWSTWKTLGNDYPVDYVGYVFEYDDLNRLKAADYGQYNVNQSSWKNKTFYDVGMSGVITYDDNGNITSLNRKDESGSTSFSETYDYFTGTNRLKRLDSGDWGYDRNGNVTSTNDLAFNSSGISYDYRNLPVSFTTPTGLSYTYDHNGLRIKSIANGEELVYIRGVNGEVLAVYEIDGMSYSIRYRNIVAGGRVVGKYLN